MNAVVSSKYGKRPVLDVPALKAYGNNTKPTSNISSMMDYNTSSLIQQPQQPAVQYVAQQQASQYVAQQPQQTQYIAQPQQTQYATQPHQTQYVTQPQQPPQYVAQPQTVQQPATQYPTAPQMPQQSGYNPFAGAYVDPRTAVTAPTYPPIEPNSFMAAMMGQFNPFNPANMLAAPLVPPPVPGFPAPPPPPNYPPPGFNRASYSQPTYGAPPPPHMSLPVHTSPEENFSISGKLEFGKMTTVHVDSITGNFKQLPEILRRELKRTYGKYAETDIKISVENGEYHIYASPHREDDRPIRGPRAYDEDDRRPFDDRYPYDHDDFKRQPRNSNDDFKPKRKEYDQDFVRGRGFEQEPRRRTELDDFRARDSTNDGEWVLVKRR